MAKIVLVAAQNYLYKGKTFEKGKPVNVSDEDRAYLLGVTDTVLKTRYFRPYVADYDEFGYPVFKDEPIVKRVAEPVGGGDMTVDDLDGDFEDESFEDEPVVPTKKKRGRGRPKKAKSSVDETVLTEVN